MLAGPGNRPSPASAATTRNLPTLQHGHKPTSVVATSAMKALADSMACGLSAGIVVASPLDALDAFGRYLLCRRLKAVDLKCYIFSI